MMIMVNWPALVSVTAGLVVLIGGSWLRGGVNAALRACTAVAAGDIILGLAAGEIVMIVSGVVILAVVGWCAWSLRESGNRNRQGR